MSNWDIDWGRGWLCGWVAAWFIALVVYPTGMAQGQSERALLDMPTAQEVQSWGFTVDEYQSLVRRKFDLLMEESRLMEQLTDRPYGTEDGMRHEAIASAQKELFLRRVDPRTHTVTRFRELGTHTRMLHAAERSLFDRLQQNINTLRQRVQIVLDAKAPTRQVVPPGQSPPQDLPVRGGAPGHAGSAAADLEIVEPRPLGSVPAGEQPPFNQQQTGRGTAGTGVQQSGQASAGGREPVQPNPNYQGPPLMDDHNMRGTVKPLGQVSAPPAEPWPNPNYRGPPAVDDPGLRGTVKPLDKPAPPKPPTTAESIAPTITLALANLEGILRCREAEVPARDCLLGLMVGNGIAATMPLAAQLLSAATVVKLSIGGQVLLIGKGAWDSYQFLDGLQGAARAEYQAWLAQRNRLDWLRRNMEIRDMPGYIAQLRRRIDDTLAPLAVNMEARCEDLARMAGAAAPAMENIALTLQEMPEKSAILAMEPYYDTSMDALANERALRRDLAALRQAFAALGGDAARIAVFQQSAEGLAGRARAHIAVEDELAAAKDTLDKAFALMARMRSLSTGAVPYERLEALGQRIDQTRSSRAGQAEKLRIEVQALKRAFPKKEIETWTEAELLSLDAAIDRHLRQDCKPADMIAAHRQGAGPATETLLDAQNRLEPADLIHASLSRLAYGTGREVLDAVQGMLQRIRAAFPASDSQPSDKDGGFRHEATRAGGGPGGGRHDLASDQGGFAHEGTTTGATADYRRSPPASQAPPESVTYFDRPWLPQSWKTGGDSQQTRAHIYQAASRLGWAAALAEYTEAVSDPLIIDHLNAAAGHFQFANQYSFAPHKAWPDWQRRKDIHGQWIRRLTQGSASSRAYFRKGLDNLIRTEAGNLREQLKTLSQYQAGALANCDSYTFQIGFDLAQAAQLQSIALDGMRAGKDKDWARQLMNKASASAASAGRYIQEIKPTPQQKGCPDYTPLIQELNQVKSRLMSAQQPELHGVWSRALALSGGQASGAMGECEENLAGLWLNNGYSGMTIQFTRQGDRYLGSFAHITPKWRRLGYRTGQVYLEARKTAPRTYEGTRHFITCENCTNGVIWKTEPLKLQVFGTWLGTSIPGEAHTWQRITPVEASRLTVRTNNFGIERFYIPGYHVPFIHDTLKDCQGPRNQHGKPYGLRTGTTSPRNEGINLLGTEVR